MPPILPEATRMTPRALGSKGSLPKDLLQRALIQLLQDFYLPNFFECRQTSLYHFSLSYHFRQNCLIFYPCHCHCFRFWVRCHRETHHHSHRPWPWQAAEHQPSRSLLAIQVAAQSCQFHGRVLRYRWRGNPDDQRVFFHRLQILSSLPPHADAKLIC